MRADVSAVGQKATVKKLWFRWFWFRWSSRAAPIRFTRSSSGEDDQAVGRNNDVGRGWEAV